MTDERAESARAPQAPEGPALLSLAPGVRVEARHLHWRFLRAAGPGGQNVNKVATAVQLRFDLPAALYLPADQRERLARLAGQRLDAHGRILIEAHRFRTQEANRRDALARLADLIGRAAVRPKRRIATRPTRASNERRLEAKRREAGRKRLRSAPPGD